MNILMSHPKYYAIRYSINPWMNVENQVISNEAVQQWTALYGTIIKLGNYVHLVEPAESLPDIVFTANSGFRFGKKIIISNFKYKERQPESAIYKDWFDKNDYKTHTMPDGVSFEGAGDALMCGDIIFCGHGFRSDLKATDFIKETFNNLGLTVVPLKLIDPYFYHLDTCFCPLNEHTALIYPGAFDRDSLAEINDRISTIEVTKEDAKKFACNAVVLDNQIIIPAGCPDTKKDLSDFIVHEVEMSQFIKAGGACRCLTLVV